MAAIRRYFQGEYEQDRYRKSLAEHNIGDKEVMLYDRIALERHDYTATRAERLQNAKHWILRLNADGPQKPLRQRPEFAVALKQCLKMQDAHLTETRHWYRYVQIINNANEKINNSKEEKTSITMSIGKLDGSTTEIHGETRRQRLHLQHRSGKTHNGKRVGAHGIPHHLIKGGDFGFLEGIP